MAWPAFSWPYRSRFSTRLLPAAIELNSVTLLTTRNESSRRIDGAGEQLLTGGLRTSKSGWVLAAIAFLVTLGYCVVALRGPLSTVAGAQYDDAFITYRYAANLASGNGLVFNIGDNTNSSTSLLWTLILSVGYGAVGSDLTVNRPGFSGGRVLPGAVAPGRCSDGSTPARTPSASCSRLRSAGAGG